MRVFALVAVALVAGLAGCTSSTPKTTTDDQLVAPVHGALPHAIQDAQNVVGGLDVANGDPTGMGVVPAAPCNSPVSPCIPYKFTVNETTGNVTYRATLGWSLQTNDFDLYLYHDGKLVDLSGNGATNPTGPLTSEELKGTLAPGLYEFAIDPYAVTQDTYHFNATFAYATL